MKRLWKTFWKSKNWGWRLLRFTLSAYLLVVAGIVVCQSRLIFRPEPYPPGDWHSEPASHYEGQIAPKFEDCRLKTSDAVTLNGCYCTPQRWHHGRWVPVAAQKVVLFFHGNGGNLTLRYALVQRLVTFPVNVFLLDYRGYGKSGGSPDETGLYHDADAAWNSLTANRRIPAHQIILFGESLGTGVAVDLASRVHPGGLILQSAFTSMSDMAALDVPFVPRLFLRTKMESLHKISLIHCPKLLIHDPDDAVVPYWMGRQLFAAASGPKQFYTLAGVPHGTTVRHGAAAYYAALRRFIQSCSLTTQEMH